MARSSSTVDTSNVAHHGRVAHVWWDPEGPVRMLHQLNNIRVPFICDGLKKTANGSLKGLKVLDAACGGGILSEALALLGAEVTGVDASEELIRVATSHSSREPRLQTNMPRFICSSIEDHVLDEPEAYDVVVASEIVEHVLDHELFLQACVQALRPGGHMFITTPQRNLAAWWWCIVWLEYTLGSIRRGTHHYKLFLSQENASKILQKYNCSTNTVRGFGYSYLKGSWSWDYDNWYALQAQKKNN